MEKLNQETIDLLLSKKFNENFWFFELGRAETLLVGDEKIEHQFMSSFFDKGVQLWEKYKNILKAHLCDTEKKEPKPFVKTVTNEGLIDLVHNLIEYMEKSHDIVQAIAIPICGILINKGVTTLCK
jgi:hypothetical protein